jgi:hypothetical protein
MKAWLEGHNFEVWCSAQLSMGYPDSLNDLRKATAFLCFISWNLCICIKC